MTFWTNWAKLRKIEQFWEFLGLPRAVFKMNLFSDFPMPYEHFWAFLRFLGLGHVHGDCLSCQPFIPTAGNMFFPWFLFLLELFGDVSSSSRLACGPCTMQRNARPQVKSPLIKTTQGLNLPCFFWVSFFGRFSEPKPIKKDTQQNCM